MIFHRYSLLLIDTIRVTSDASIILTDVKKKLNDVCYYFSVSILIGVRVKNEMRLRMR
jgi:nucleosome binding factor SPN SPT16 subunit